MATACSTVPQISTFVGLVALVTEMTQRIMEAMMAKEASVKSEIKVNFLATEMRNLEESREELP